MASFAIDLGTTNTSVAMANELMDNSIRVNPIKIQQLDKSKAPIALELLPSAVYLDDNGKIYTGKIAKEMREVRGNRVLSNYKRYMGKEFTMNIGDRSFNSRELSTEVLKSCKRAMDKYGYKEGDKITITVPASFDSDQIKDTVDAAELARLSNVNIIPESTAALLDYINEKIIIAKEENTINFSVGKRILVLDIGGGTYDISIIDVKQEDKKVDFTELAVGRYDELGGVDFDLIVQKYLLKNFCNERKIDFSLLKKEEQNFMVNSLRVFAEKAKEYISANLEFGIDDEPYRQFLMSFYNGEDVEFSIDRKEYDTVTKSLYEYGKESLCYDDLLKNKNIIDPILEILREYKIKKESLDLVFLTGGMSQFATVSEKLKDILNLSEEKIIKSPYPLEAVSRGAALYQYYDANFTKLARVTDNKLYELSETEELKENQQETEIKITKVMAEAIMVDVVEGLPVTIIERNQGVPYSGSIKGSLRTTSPAGIVVNLYSGNDQFDWKMKLQKSKRALFKEPIKLGTAIDIDFDIDENKYLTMSVMVGNEIIELNNQLSEIEVSEF